MKNEIKKQCHRTIRQVRRASRLYRKGFLEIVIPHICVICNSHLSRDDYCLCPFCCDTYFERAASGHSVQIYPEYVAFQVSLWEFGKGTVLQDLMHSLKYENMYGIGLDIGRRLGICLESQHGKELRDSGRHPLLLPVPLHSRRKKRRGYNQARAIAEGIGYYTGWPVAVEGSVIRVKKTGPQSGLTVRERRENLKSAFRMVNLKTSCSHYPIIVDDIFTTGATTFELARMIANNGFTGAGIATVARA